MKTTKTFFATMAITFAFAAALPVKAQGLFGDDKKKETKKSESKKSSSSSSSSGGDYGYKTAIGLRGGFTSGLTVKHFISDKAAIEGILGSRWRGLSITGLYELHKTPAINFSNLAWEYGGGARIGFYNGRYYHKWDDDDGYYENRSYVAVGIVGIFGLEYQFNEIPFTASLDLMPYFDFIGWGGGFIDGSISFRYTF